MLPRRAFLVWQQTNNTKITINKTPIFAKEKSVIFFSSEPTSTHAHERVSFMARERKLSEIYVSSCKGHLKLFLLTNVKDNVKIEKGEKPQMLLYCFPQIFPCVMYLLLQVDNYQVTQSKKRWQFVIFIGEFN